VLIYSYINTRGIGKTRNCVKTLHPSGVVFPHNFSIVFPISTRVDITVYQHENVLYLLNGDQDIEDNNVHFILYLFQQCTNMVENQKVHKSSISTTITGIIFLKKSPLHLNNIVLKV
jgi:hypothetical protein